MATSDKFDVVGRRGCPSTRPCKILVAFPRVRDSHIMGSIHGELECKVTVVGDVLLGDVALEPDIMVMMHDGVCANWRMK